MVASCPHCSSDHHTRKRLGPATMISSKPTSHPYSAHLLANTPPQHHPTLSCVTITLLSRSAGYSSQPVKPQSNTLSRSSLPSTVPPSLDTKTSSSFKISLSPVNAKGLIFHGHASVPNHSFAHHAWCRMTVNEILNSSSVSNPALFADRNRRLR